MAINIIRALGYTGTRQVFTWPSSASYNNRVTAYLWGGGGGGGGNDDTAGGYGGGGGYATYSFSASPGDVLEISVGGPGGQGGTNPGTGGSAGGSPGASLVLGGSVFNSRYNLPGVYAVSNGAWCTFLNNTGVWAPDSAGYFDRSAIINFPSAGVYTVEGSFDNEGWVYIDGALVLYIPGEYGYQRSYSTAISFSAGNHNIRVVGSNWHGPGGAGVTINGGDAYSGGRGGRAGYGGWSGGGGGGGGATVFRVNTSVRCVAGGGAGGGGGGDNSGGQSAPGGAGQAGAGTNNGQDGRSHPSDGGGGGAGGGGWGGGNGGGIPGGDNGAYAGYFGGQRGNYGENPSGTGPGGRSNRFYPGGVGWGGANTHPGSPGYAVIEFEINGTFVNVGGAFQPVKQTWVKDSGVWRAAQGVYVKRSNVWEPVDGTLAPNFVNVGGGFGYSSRPY